MPFEKPEVWERHFFTDIQCPKNVIIPTSDDAAWKKNPGYRWVYNKINLCNIQGLRHGPHGIDPDFYPVFSKPIYNLWGMGMGCQILTDKKMADENYSPGHFWMEILEGEHSSIDVVMVNGEPQWMSKTVGFPSHDQMFDYWNVNIQTDKTLKDIIPKSILKHLSSYTGHVNFEMIGDTVIEIHLRLSSEFVVFYGKSWLESIAYLYENQKWKFSDSTTSGYSVPLFIDNDIKTANIDYNFVKELENNEKILNIQICIDDDGYINGLANPKNGNRIAVINSLDLDEALTIREILKKNILL